MKTIFRRKVNCASFHSCTNCSSPREEICCATSNLLCKGKLCCHGERHNASCCALCPVCDVYASLSRWWWGHKSLVWTATTDSPLLFFGGAAILAVQVSSCTQEHRQTWLQGSTELSQSRCRLRRSKLALSKLPSCLRCIWVRHQILRAQICAVLFFNFETWAHMNRTVSCKGYCYCLLAAVSFLRGLLICGITWSYFFTPVGLVLLEGGSLSTESSSCSKSTSSRILFSLFEQSMGIGFMGNWQMTTPCTFWLPQIQTDTIRCSTRKQPTQVTQTRTIPSGVLRVSKWLLIGLPAQADIGANRLIQNNTSDHVNLYLRGDQM